MAEKEQLPVLSMCTGCTQTLMEARDSLKDPDAKQEVNDAGIEYSGENNIVFYAELIHKLMHEIEIEKKVDLRVASHPGCHILRPSRILQFDDPEDPKKLDELLRFIGAEPVDYPKKGFCCGFPMYFADPAAAGRMMKDKMASFSADALAVLCPTCFEYYQLRQKQIASEQGFEPVMVIHYLQLLGMALGLENVYLEELRVRNV